jgi:hypothetical protein
MHQRPRQHAGRSPNRINQQDGAAATNSLVLGIVASLLATAVVALHIFLGGRAQRISGLQAPAAFIQTATLRIPEAPSRIVPR